MTNTVATRRAAVRWLWLLTSPLAPVAAQGLMLRDPIVMEPHMVAYDRARLRLVEVGRHGETRELDGTRWLLRPGPGPRLYGALSYREAAGRMFACGMSYDLVAETWEHDGNAWQRRTPAVQPSARTKFAIAYDILRDRVVVFSGTGSGLLYGDTWEWDGTNWLQRVATGPVARQDGSMAFDIARGRCVLFGGQASGVGLQGETWEWDGTSWILRVLPNPPSPRVGPALAYDPMRARIVLHGGFDLSGSSGVSSEVWEYDGVSWQLMASGGGPGARYKHDLVFDAGRGEVLAVGGAESGTGIADIHSWNGVRWQPVVPVPLRPGSFYGVRAVAEPIQGGVLAFAGTTWRFANGDWTLLPATSAWRAQPAMWSDGTRAWFFGGHDNINGVYFSDTWSWNGTNWQRSFLSARPPARSRAGVAFDPVRGHAVLFGGYAGSSAPFADTWTFDGTTWQQRTPAVVPPGRSDHGMAFDPARARVVMFGGTGPLSSLLSDTWEWNGANWAQVATPVRPPAHGVAAMHYDRRIQRTVMTTAQYSGSMVPTSIEAWTYDGATWSPLPLLESRVIAHDHSVVEMPGTASLFVVDGTSALELVYQPPRVENVGTPCDAFAPRLGARSWPSPGSADFGIDVVAAPPLGVVALGASPAAANLPVGNCTLLVAPPPSILLGFANGQGFASLPIPVPPRPSLLGTQWFFQAAVLRPVAPGGLSLSAALRVVVGE